MPARPTARHAVALLLLLGIGVPPLHAQTPDMPTGWRALTDTPGRFVPPGIEPGAGREWNFTRMPPGWHITNGPGMILFDPSARAEGRYRLETEFFLFPHPTDQPLGLFIGGTGLDGPLAGVQWFGLLVRRDGMAGVMHNHGTEHHPMVPYARSDSLVPHPGAESQRITLAIDVDADSVRFFVNRARLAAVPRAGLNLDGPFGFRVGRGLNLHVVRLDHTMKLAPGRGGGA